MLCYLSNNNSSKVKKNNNNNTTIHTWFMHFSAHTPFLRVLQGVQGDSKLSLFYAEQFLFPGLTTLRPVTSPDGPPAPSFPPFTPFFHKITSWVFPPRGRNAPSHSVEKKSNTDGLFFHRNILKVIQSCLTLQDPMDYTVRGILQARILEWVAIPFSRGSSQPRD